MHPKLLVSEYNSGTYIALAIKFCGVIGEEKYQAKLREITTNLDQLRDRLRRIEAIEGATKTDASTAETFVDLYDSEPKVGKRIILNRMFTICVSGGCVKLEFNLAMIPKLTLG
jgi:hypothetical protein